MFAIRIMPLLLMAASARNKVQIDRIGVLTFQAGEMTTSNRGAPVSKLQCTGGCFGDVKQARCKNDGTDDYGEVNWRCTASVPKGCKFLETTVSCENYSANDDGWIVPGSCALIYALQCERLNAAGEEEQKLKSIVAQKRAQQQEMMLDEVLRIKTQAARDDCKLAIAGAIYPLNYEVEVMKNGAQWKRGDVASIACDGSYTVSFGQYEQSGLAEDELRPFVETVYKEVVIDAPVRHRSSADSVTYSGAYSDSNHDTRAPSSHGHASGSSGGRYKSPLASGSSPFDFDPAVVGGIALVAVVLAVAYFVSKSGGGGSRGGGGSGGGNVRTWGETPGGSQGKGHGGHGRMAGALNSNHLLGAGMAAAAAYSASSAERARPKWKTGAAASSRSGGQTATSPTASPANTRLRRRQVDHEGTERLRALKIKMLTAKKKIALAISSTRIDAAERARLSTYRTKIEQIEREITNDTAQLGNVMQRFDHVMDQWEGFGYAKTVNR